MHARNALAPPQEFDLSTKDEKLQEDQVQRPSNRKAPDGAELCSVTDR